MKKIYLLSLLCCLSLAAFSQQLYQFASSGSGTFRTGYATTSSRVDNNIVTQAAVFRGYAVFDLSAVPSGATITEVEIGYYLWFYSAGTTTPCNTYGYAGDLSLVTVPATLFADMVGGTLLYSSPFGSSVGNQKLPTTAAAVIFAQANIGSKISISWTNGGSSQYQIRGETGASTPGDTTMTDHAPYIRIKYCVAPTGVTATALPSTLCEGDNLALTGTATGASVYSWAGPGGYSAGTLTATNIVTPASAGVYTFTATNICGTSSASTTVTTTAVTVNPLPLPVTGTNIICAGSATPLSPGTPGGTWTSSSGVATVGSSSGLVTGVSAGTVRITYTLGTGCYVTFPMTVNNTPSSIFGPTSVCAGSTINLFDGVGGGTWSSSLPGTGSVSATGVVTGVSAGTVTITYGTTGCATVTHDVTVNPVPSPIVGPAAVCVLSTINLTDPTPGGTWTSSLITRAMVGSTTGIVTGVAAGAVNIIYSDAITGCQAILPIVVNAVPAAIVGPATVCEGLTITLTDASPGGSFSGGAPNAWVSAGGVVTGITTGAANITYTIGATGCLITDNIYVYASPAPITGTLLLCANTTSTLADMDAGGTWSSSLVGTATVGSSSGIVTGIAGGNANISYTMPAGCSAVVVVTVNPAPSAVVAASGPTTFCTGSNVILTAPAGAGLTYQWSVGGSPIAGQTNMSYTASTTGNYTVDVTNSFGCVTRSASIPVQAGFSAFIDFTTPLNFCIGSHVVLSANVGTAVGVFTYQWQLNGVNIPSATGISYTATTSGIYTCVVGISGGSGTCTATTPPETVVVNALPTPSINYNGTALYTGIYAAYQWYLNGVGVAGANSQYYTPVSNGLFRVRVTDGIGCPGYSGYYNITGVGVPQVNNASSVAIYPNPATDVVHIESSVSVQAVITNAEGQKLVDVANAQEINISSFSTGLYIIKLFDENGQMLLVQKLIKQ
jgi:uncharacterized protein YjdB